MAKKRIVSESRKKVIQDFLVEYQPKTAKELQELLKDLIADTVQSMLESSLISQQYKVASSIKFGHSGCITTL